MKMLRVLAVSAMLLGAIRTAAAETACVLMDDRSSASGYENGGPFDLSHFKLTDGRLEIRDFLWQHWHSRTKGMAEVRVGTVDAGTVRVFYLIRPDSLGVWGIDVAMKRPLDKSCAAFHADSLVRLPIEKPDEDYLAQTMGFWPPDQLPKKRVDDQTTLMPKLYQVQLVKLGKPIGDVL